MLVRTSTCLGPEVNSHHGLVNEFDVQRPSTVGLITGHLHLGDAVRDAGGINPTVDRR